MVIQNSQLSKELIRIQRVYNILKSNPTKAYFPSWLQKETNISQKKMIAVLTFLYNNKLVFRVRVKESNMYYYNKRCDDL
jgi:hypothetical protein